jgi:S-DNA-T family DNA segregation ATPase FtsK/SpoIIIE
MGIRKRATKQRVVKQRKAPSERWGEVLGIFLLGISAFIFLALISYDPLDISLTTAQPNDPAHNYIGLIGAWFSFTVLFLFGLACFLIPIFIGFLGIRSFFNGMIHKFWVWTVSVFASLISLACIL